MDGKLLQQDLRDEMMNSIINKYGSYANGLAEYENWFNGLDDLCIHLGCGYPFKYRLSSGKSSPIHWGLPSYLYNKSLQPSAEIMMIARLLGDQVELIDKPVDRM